MKEKTAKFYEDEYCYFFELWHPCTSGKFFSCIIQHKIQNSLKKGSKVLRNWQSLEPKILKKLYFSLRREKSIWKKKQRNFMKMNIATEMLTRIHICLSPNLRGPGVAWRKFCKFGNKLFFITILVQFCCTIFLQTTDFTIFLQIQ